MTQSNGEPPSYLDRRVLDRLLEELDDDEGILRVFVQNFIKHLPDREERLRLALTTGDLDGATDAVLSPKTSAQMIGAERLADLATNLQGSLCEARDTDPALTLPRLAANNLRPIKLCSHWTSYLLKAHFQEDPSRARFSSRPSLRADP